MSDLLSRRRLLGFALGSLVIGTAGCQATSGSTAPSPSVDREVSTAHGPVRIPTRPARIVTVAYDTPFQLLAVGVTPVGALDYSALYDQYPADQVTALKAIPAVGSFGEPDLDTIAALEPDLILGVGEEVDDAVYAKLAQLAPTALFAQPSRADWETVATAVADAAGAAGKLNEVRDQYRSRVSELSSRYAAQLSDQRWVHYSFGDTDGQFSVQFPTGATGAILQSLGASFASVVASAQPEAGYQSYSIEKADLLSDATIGLHPLDSAGQEFAGLAATQQTKVWQALPFVAEGRDFGLIQLTGVNTYPAGVAALAELEQKVLKRL